MVLGNEMIVVMDLHYSKVDYEIFLVRDFKIEMLIGIDLVRYDTRDITNVVIKRH